MKVIDLLNLCDRVYDESPIVGGPNGRDGAALTFLSTGECVLAFRGTLVNEDLTSLLDWVNDFIAVLVQDEGFPGRVHKGFLDSLNSLWNGVITSLVANGYQQGVIPWERKLVITGHSKGGALAVLAGCRLAALKPTVVTFAAPMTGDLGFAVDYPPTVSVTRYEGRDDLVPWLPPVGYRPVGDVQSQTEEEWKPRHSHAHLLMADLLDPVTREMTWKRVHKAHSLVTGYLPWIDNSEVRQAA